MTKTAQALQELKEWFKNEQEAQELARLRLLRRRYEQGDRDALAEATGAPIIPVVARPTADRANLPRPEPPHRYEKKNRADYNQWLRDNEDYHTKNPTYFSEDKQKVSFALQYVTESLRTLWETWVSQEVILRPYWTPTWDDLKEKMLGALGSLEERRQFAYDSIKAAKQRSHQSPTDLLNYLRPLWVEIGEVNPYRMVAEFTAALHEEVRRELRHLPPQNRQTLPQVEESTNRIYRELIAEGKLRKKSEKDSKRATTPPGSEKSQKGTKRARKDRHGKGSPKESHDSKGGPRFVPTCYACNKEGHIVKFCRNAEKKAAYIKEKEKVKGQKG